jgi:hypothetical protein
MPLSQFIGGEAFDPETVIAMTTAFDEALKEFNVTDQDAPLAENVAKRIIEFAHSGERDPKLLCSLAVLSIQP